MSPTPTPTPERVDVLEVASDLGAPGAAAALARARRDLAASARRDLALAPLAPPSTDSIIIVPPVVAAVAALAASESRPETVQARREARQRERLAALAERCERERERATRALVRERDALLERLGRGNGRARERTLGTDYLLRIAREVAREAVGVSHTDDGGGVGRSYLRSWSATTTCAVWTRVAGGVRVSVTRERLSQYRGGGTYGEPLASASAEIPLRLLAEPLVAPDSTIIITGPRSLPPHGYRPGLPLEPVLARAVTRLRVARLGPLASASAWDAVRAGRREREAGPASEARGWRVPRRALRLRAALRRAARKGGAP